MNVQAFYKALAKVLAEKTNVNIEVKEIIKNGNNNQFRRVQRINFKGLQV